MELIWKYTQNAYLIHPTIATDKDIYWKKIIS